MPYVLSATPKAPGWFETFGTNALGSATDLLLQALMSGRMGRVPTGQGSLGLPGGGQATPGPGLQSQLNAGQLPQMIQSGQFPGGTTYNPQTRLGMLPDLSRQLQQSQIDVNKAIVQQRGQSPIDINALLHGGNTGNQSSIYQVGDVIDRNGKEYEIVGFDADGTPLVEPR